MLNPFSPFSQLMRLQSGSQPARDLTPLKCMCRNLHSKNQPLESDPFNRGTVLVKKLVNIGYCSF